MFRKAMWISGLLCLLVALAGHRGMAQDDIGLISGTVTAEDGRPLTGAVIAIDRDDVKGHYETKTDKNGKFVHIGLPLGRYTISVIKDGKKSITVPNVHNRLRGATTVDIDLSK
jgi:protocatechuate 3,4-dioxygenase beta subunit